MFAFAKALRFTRGLRFRLALSYVFFFTILLVLLGILFRQTLSVTFQAHLESVLDEEWGAAKGYFQFGPSGPGWVWDQSDPDEDFIVRRMQRVYMLADSQGHMLQSSETYDSVGRDTPAEIKQILQSGTQATRVGVDGQGIRYIIRSGTMTDEKRRKYYLAIGRPMEDNDKVLRNFTWNYFSLVPVVIVLTGLLGWFLAGRALAPVNSVAETAQRITHSSLDMQIPLRQANDELDRLIEAFNHMMTRLNFSFEQIRQFSIDVSHELRTPLTIVRGQLEVAMFTAQTVDQYREAMADTLEDVDRLSNIVRALFMLSQAESGQVVLQKTPIDFAALVGDLVDQYQIPADAQGVRLSAALPEQCPILADRVQIERLVSNLLGNAVKYTPSGGEVRVRLALEGLQAIFVIEDTGVGIAADHLPHIFDRFYRVPSADPEKGLGLGLSFVAWIVKAHGGTIEVESALEKGTRFIVSLPAGHLVTGQADAPATPLAEKVH